MEDRRIMTVDEPTGSAETSSTRVDGVAASPTGLGRATSVDDDAAASKEPQEEGGEKVQEKDPDSPFLNCEMGKGREAIFIAVIACAQLLTQASLGQVLAPLNIIGESLGTTSPGQLSWFAAAYSLTVGIFVLPAGRLGDIYGHRRLLFFGYLWLAWTSLLAGLTVYAKSHIFFDVARALQGIGPAILLPNSVAVIGRTYKPGPRKNFAVSMFAAAAPNGGIVGALLSSLFAQKAWWPWIFWSETIACVALAFCAVASVPKDPPPDWKAKFDYAGTATGVVGLVLINFAWNQSGIVGWDTVYIYVLLIVGIFLVAAFLVIEMRTKEPLVPTTIWTRPTCFMLACISLGWMSFGIWYYYLFRLFVVIRGQTPASASTNFIPCGISGLIASVLTGRLIPTVGAPRLMVCAMLAFCVALILLATAHPYDTYWTSTFFCVVIAPFGMDMSFPSATIVASDSVPPAQQGVASSLVNTVVNFSVSLGLGFAGTVEYYVAKGDTLRGYRGAEYLGIGFAGLGVIVALVNVAVDRCTGCDKDGKHKAAEASEKGKE